MTDLGLALDKDALPDRVNGLARWHGLAEVDAVYLDPALRSGLPLSTTDCALVRAASAVGVELV